MNGINVAFKRLTENDRSILKSQEDKPELWTCKWYNDNAISGYSKGALVWMNTEDVNQYITKNSTEIEKYILESEYGSEYRSISSDVTEVQQMFLNICDGRNGYRRLYYFGDLKDQTQIRISLSANNKELPTNDEWWTDAFRLSSVEDY